MPLATKSKFTFSPALTETSCSDEALNFMVIACHLSASTGPLEMVILPAVTSSAVIVPTAVYLIPVTAASGGICIWLAAAISMFSADIDFAIWTLLGCCEHPTNRTPANRTV
jgi:hypothetical protein